MQIAVFVYVAHVLSSLSSPNPNPPSPNLAHDSPATAHLPIRNPYVGLAELYAPALGNATPGTYAPIVNAPRVAAQVSRTEPARVWPEDEHRWLSALGTMSPPDRHLLVTDDVRPSRASASIWRF